MTAQSVRSRGFTLVELMVVLAILGILASIAAPNFREFVVKTRMSAATNDLLTDLAFARAEAMRRGVRVTICASSDGTTCSTQAAHWSVNRLIYSDGCAPLGELNDADNPGGNGCTDDVVARTTSLSPDLVITNSGFVTNSYMQFRPGGGVASSGSFKICRADGNAEGRSVTVTATGNSMSQITSCP